MSTADNLTTFMCQIVLKSGSLNLLEPSGPVQACNGIALALLVCYFYNCILYLYRIVCYMLKVATLLAETYSSSICAYTDFNRLVCVCWYHYCMYLNNSKIIAHMIRTNLELKVSSSELPTYRVSRGECARLRENVRYSTPI